MDPLHPTLREILSQPRNPQAIAVEKQSPDEARHEWKADMAAVDAPAPNVRKVTDFSIATGSVRLRARQYIPLTAITIENLPTLVYFHGGGFIRGDIETHDSLCRVLADSSGCSVISAEYRLAPEYPFPTAAEDAYAVVQYVSNNALNLGIDAKRIAVGGDSAGGNLAIAACLQAKQRKSPCLKFQLLIYPVTDLLHETESKRLFSKGYLLDSMPFYIASYMGGSGQHSNEMASPLLSKELSGLPPAYVITAGYDPLRDEGQSFANFLAAQGVTVEHRFYSDMIHGFVSLRALLPEADEALIECGKKLAKALQ